LREISWTRAWNASRVRRAERRGYQEIDKFGVTLRQVARRPRGMPVLDTSGAALPGSLRRQCGLLSAAVVLHNCPQAGAFVRTIDAASAASGDASPVAGFTVVWAAPASSRSRQGNSAILMRGSFALLRRQ